MLIFYLNLWREVKGEKNRDNDLWFATKNNYSDKKCFKHLKKVAEGYFFVT